MSVKLCLSDQGKNVVLREFDNRVLRKMFGSKTEDVGRGWRKAYNEEFRDLCASPNTVWPKSMLTENILPY
jgi:hypothetical protein